MTLHIGFGYKRIDQIQTVGRVGDGVAAGIAHLVFLGVFFDVFYLIGHTSLEVMTARLMPANQFEAHDVGCQVIACMFHISSYAKILLRLSVVEPVLSHNIIGLVLFGVES